MLYLKYKLSTNIDHIILYRYISLLFRGQLAEFLVTRYSLGMKLILDLNILENFRLSEE